MEVVEWSAGQIAVTNLNSLGDMLDKGLLLVADIILGVLLIT